MNFTPHPASTPAAGGDTAPSDQTYAGASSPASELPVLGTNTGSGEKVDTIHAHYFVNGMTCAHCVAAVTAEVSAIVGVDGVSVDLNASGSSRITVVSRRPIAEVFIAAAVTMAGYIPVSDH